MSWYRHREATYIHATSTSIGPSQPEWPVVSGQRPRFILPQSSQPQVLMTPAPPMGLPPPGYAFLVRVPDSAHHGSGSFNLNQAGFVPAAGYPIIQHQPGVSAMFLEPRHAYQMTPAISMLQPNPAQIGPVSNGTFTHFQPRVPPSFPNTNMSPMTIVPAASSTDSIAETSIAAPVRLLGSNRPVFPALEFAGNSSQSAVPFQDSSAEHSPDDVEQIVEEIATENQPCPTILIPNSAKDEAPSDDDYEEDLPFTAYATDVTPSEYTTTDGGERSAACQAKESQPFSSTNTTSVEIAEKSKPDQNPTDPKNISNAISGRERKPVGCETGDDSNLRQSIMQQPVPSTSAAEVAMPSLRSSCNQSATRRDVLDRNADTPPPLLLAFDTDAPPIAETYNAPKGQAREDYQGKLDDCCADKKRAGEESSIEETSPDQTESPVKEIDCGRASVEVISVRPRSSRAFLIDLTTSSDEEEISDVENLPPPCTGKRIYEPCQNLEDQPAETDEANAKKLKVGGRVSSLGSVFLQTLSADPEMLKCKFCNQMSTELAMMQHEKSCAFRGYEVNGCRVSPPFEGDENLAGSSNTSADGNPCVSSEMAIRQTSAYGCHGECKENTPSPVKCRKTNASAAEEFADHPQLALSKGSGSYVASTFAVKTSEKQLAGRKCQLISKCDGSFSTSEVESHVQSCATSLVLTTGPQNAVSSHQNVSDRLPLSSSDWSSRSSLLVSTEPSENPLAIVPLENQTHTLVPAMQTGQNVAANNLVAIAEGRIGDGSAAGYPSSSAYHGSFAQDSAHIPANESSDTVNYDRLGNPISTRDISLHPVNECIYSTAMEPGVPQDAGNPSFLHRAYHADWWPAPATVQPTTTNQDFTHSSAYTHESASVRTPPYTYAVNGDGDYHAREETRPAPNQHHSGSGSGVTRDTGGYVLREGVGCQIA